MTVSLDAVDECLWAIVEDRGDKGAVGAYLDSIDGNGKLDHFEVFGELVLRAHV